MNQQKKVKKHERSETLRSQAIEPGAAFIPQVDVIEKQDCIQILADMPGVSRENVNAVLEEGVLTISGKAAPSEEELTLQSSEYEIGDFYRSFAVGDGLDTEGIDASMQDGVLNLCIPKSEQYKPRQIEVK